MKSTRTAPAPNSGSQMSLASQEFADLLNHIPEDVVRNKFQFSFPLYSHAQVQRAVDEDGFPIVTQENLYDLKKLQQECWNKFEMNPQINSHVRDVMGRMTGWGFGFSSEVHEIQQAITEVVEDPRNDLLQNMPKFCARSEVEGELFLMLSVHTSGFVEVDFISPRMISGGGDKESGIIFHPEKQWFPLFYLINFDNEKPNADSERQVIVPSINVAYFPDLEKEVTKHPSYDTKKLKKSKSSSQMFKQFNGYSRFMIHWNRGFMTRRNVSHIRTTIEWVNYYEDLKKYEIDHKKSSGAYLWVVEVEDWESFKNWLNLSEEDRKKTGIEQPKDPGGTLVLPPGLKLSVQNPKLNSISDQDTDLMQMVSSGLNKPQDLMLGDYRSTYASVKAAQGPQSDRVNDDLAYFHRFLVYNFWRPVFFLKSRVTDFAEHRRVNQVIEFDKGEPIWGKVNKPSYKLIDVSFPVSKLEDINNTAQALLGAKHGSVVDTLGIPRREVAKRLGFAEYPTLRKEKATEDELYPETLSTLDQESAQERAEAEPSRANQNQNSNKPQKSQRTK